MVCGRFDLAAPLNLAPLTNCLNATACGGNCRARRNALRTGPIFFGAGAG